jgi:hypothetical protein
MGHYNGGTHTAYSELSVPGVRGSLCLQNACRSAACALLLADQNGIVWNMPQGTNVDEILNRIEGLKTALVRKRQSGMAGTRTLNPNGRTLRKRTFDRRRLIVRFGSLAEGDARIWDVRLPLRTDMLSVGINVH